MGKSRSSLLAAVAACLAATGLSGGAGAQVASPKRDSGARGAPGAIVQFEERASAGVVYLEETGGMASAQAPEAARKGEAVVAREPAQAVPAVALRKLA